MSLFPPSHNHKTHLEPFLSNSLEVADSYTYQYLKSGRTDGLYEVIVVRVSAIEEFAKWGRFGEKTSEIFTLVKLFAEANTPIIRFTNRYDSYIELSTVDKRVTAHFDDADHFPLADLPSNYNAYEIYYGPKTFAREQDVDAILTWTSAEQIVIDYKTPYADDGFLKRIESLKNNEHIKKIRNPPQLM